MGLFSSSNKSTTTSQKDNTATWQTPYVQGAMSSAQGLFNSKQGSPWYTGQTHAGLDPLTTQAIGGVQNYATGAGADAASKVGVSSLGLLGSSGNYLDQIGKYSASAGADPTQANVGAAALYGNNPYMDSMVDSASRDVRRNLTENTMPSIDRDATATGGINSSRAGIAEGIAQRGAQDQIGDISAQLRGNAYENGLNLAEQGRESNMNATGTAAGLYGSALQTGMNGANLGQTMNYTNFGKLDNAGQINQQDNQGAMNDALNRWQQNDTRDQGLLSNYMGTVGGNSWGSSGTEAKKETTSPSLANLAMGIGSMAMGVPSFGSGATGLFSGSGYGGMGGVSPALLNTPSLASFPGFSMAPVSVPRLG